MDSHKNGPAGQKPDGAEGSSAGDRSTDNNNPKEKRLAELGDVLRKSDDTYRKACFALRLTRKRTNPQGSVRP